MDYPLRVHLAQRLTKIKKPTISVSTIIKLFSDNCVMAFSALTRILPTINDANRIIHMMTTDVIEMCVAGHCQTTALD
jgi:hypothetical protein